MGRIKKQTRLLWLMPILLTAAFLRIHDLYHIPPGLTHDEADHGITAQAILAGERAVYFTIGYGREPLFDYATAAVMGAIGPTFFAGRVTAVFFSMLILALLFSLTKTVLDTPTALLATAALAVGFWAVMTGRQSLRSITLPLFFLAGSALYLRTVLSNWSLGISERNLNAKHPKVITEHRTQNASNLQLKVYSIRPYIAAGLLFGLSLYTYIPARVMWLVVPVVLIYLLLFATRVLGHVWWGSAVLLLMGGLVGAPLFRYLAANPNAEIRIQELRAPLTALRQGNLWPLLQNGLATLRLFFIEGDGAWRYNIAGRPWLPWWLALFFVIGVVVVVVWAIRPFRSSADSARKRGLVAWFLVAWFLLGFAPVIVTGPELSTTQAIGMQPVLYLLVGIGMKQVGDWGLKMGGWGLWTKYWQPKAQGSQLTAYSLQLAAIALTALTTHLAIQRWGSHPEVRVQYESAMVTVIDYVNKLESDAVVSISTITPGQYHTPALAAMTLQSDATPRWFDASGSLLIANAPASTVIVSGFAPLGQGMVDYFDTAVPRQTLPQPATDRDRPLTVYAVDLVVMSESWRDEFVFLEEEVKIGDAISLRGVDINQESGQVGDSVQVGTLWQIHRPIMAEARLFTHMLGPDGVPLAQQDRLDAPATGWHSNDWLIQLHTFRIPEATTAGTYPLAVGLYTCPQSCESGQRLPVSINGRQAGTSYPIGEISITP